MWGQDFSFLYINPTNLIQVGYFAVVPRQKWGVVESTQSKPDGCLEDKYIPLFRHCVAGYTSGS